MRTLALLAAVALSVGACWAADKAAVEEGWIVLFDGTSMDGWQATEKKESFSVRDGMLCVESGRSHLFYMGPVKNHDFKNFEFKADVMTTPRANSGIFFHTGFQATGWPGKGYEAQVNTTHGDPVKTGSLYHVQDVKTAPSKDNEWFNYHIIVTGKHIVFKIDGKVVMDYTEPEAVQAPQNRPGRGLSSGTFAIQGHDPGSKVYYKNIMVKPLPD
jgi:hypothetical protein